MLFMFCAIFKFLFGMLFYLALIISTADANKDFQSTVNV